MDNPYEKITPHPSEVTFGRVGVCIMTLLFGLGILSVPAKRHLEELKKNREERWFPLVEIWKHPNQKSYNHLFEKRSRNSLIQRETPNLRDHFQSFESAVENSAIRKRTRETDQAFLSSAFGKGNRKVIQAREGWLYYEPGATAITGLGPLHPEMDSVAKDPDRPRWNEPLAIIESFAAQLHQRGIELVIVPVPVKPMIETAGLEARGFIKHPDQDEFYGLLRNRGIEVLDLFPAFESWASEGDLYLRQDTHWTNATAKRAARFVAEKIQTRDWYQDREPDFAPLLDTVTRSSIGDLVGMLGVPEANGLFKIETQPIERVLDPETGQVPHGDLMSPLSIIGDSFVNIYEEPGLGFGEDEEEGTLIGAGFASHLSAFLQMRPHVMAINGEGATGVREAFASLPDNIVRSRKMVLWVLASRDLLLSESAAIRAGVFWREIEFNPHRENLNPGTKATDGIVLTGTLAEKSSIGDPQKTPYTEAIYSTVFEKLTVESGEYHEEEAAVFLWAFRDRKLLPGASLEPGKTYRLELVPLVGRSDLQKKQQIDNFKRFDLDPMFAIKVEAVPPQ